MKILSAEQKARVDAYTIKHEPISSFDLMDRAARACADWIISNIEFSSMAIVCGKGNNGGDGLSMALYLNSKSHHVHVYIVEQQGKGSDDFEINLSRLQLAQVNIEYIKGDDIPDFESYDLIVDALFGSGLSRPLEGIFVPLVSKVNECSTPVISIDVPSGLPMQGHVSPEEISIVKADIVLCIESPSLNLLLPDYEAYNQHFELISIGWDKRGVKREETDYFYLDSKWAKSVFTPRQKHSHKGDHGHALIIAGSFGKMGACILATKASLRAGTGLTTAYIPSRGYDILQSQVPEAMVYCNVGERIYYPSEFETDKTVGIGPGIGTDQPTAEFVRDVLESYVKPMVIDADALNILAEHKEWIKLIPPRSILTPHPGELKRLIGDWANDYDKLDKMKAFAQEHQLILLCKGAHTVIVTPKGRFYFNSTGNPGMGTAGSGDVLTGIITGLLAQGYKPKHAALLGVYLHGLSADFVVEDTQSEESVMASDLIEYLGAAFVSLQDE